MYSLHFTAAWARGAGKGGTDDALWNRLRPRLHGQRWEAMTFEWMFLGNERRSIPGRGVEGSIANEGLFF